MVQISFSKQGLITVLIFTLALVDSNFLSLYFTLPSHFDSHVTVPTINEIIKASNFHNANNWSVFRDS